jgi:anti-sigma28 factor (negative regulator of flagellin synthesis)
MIISRAEIESAISAYHTSVKRKRTTPASVMFDTADRYELSDGTSVLSALAQTIEAEPFFRAGLVAELSHRIAEGRYYVPTDEIVEKLLGRLIAEAIPA